jgi:hypothetical protein
MSKIDFEEKARELLYQADASSERVATVAQCLSQLAADVLEEAARAASLVKP